MMAYRIYAGTALVTFLIMSIILIPVSQAEGLFPNKSSFLKDPRASKVLKILDERWGNPIPLSLWVENVKVGVYSPSFLRKIPVEDRTFQAYALSELDAVGFEDARYYAEHDASFFIQNDDFPKTSSLPSHLRYYLDEKRKLFSQIRVPKFYEDLLYIWTMQFDAETQSRFLTVFESYLENRLPSSAELRQLPNVLLSVIANLADRSMLWTSESIQEVSEKIKESILFLHHQTGKLPYVIELGAGMGDLTEGVQALLKDVLPQDHFVATEFNAGEDKKYDLFRLRGRKVLPFNLYDLEEPHWKQKLGLPEEAQVILVASHLTNAPKTPSRFSPNGIPLLTLLDNQKDVDEMIFVHTFLRDFRFNGGHLRRSSGGIDSDVVDRNMWFVKSWTPDPMKWINGVTDPGYLKQKMELRRQPLLLQRYRRNRHYVRKKKQRFNHVLNYSAYKNKWKSSQKILSYIEYHNLYKMDKEPPLVEFMKGLDTFKTSKASSEWTLEDQLELKELLTFSYHYEVGFGEGKEERELLLKWIESLFP